MNKEFTLQNFKSASSNASDYLKGKGHDVSRAVMLNMLSVFLGAKNWNTLEAQLSKSNIVRSDGTIKNELQGLIVVISKDKDEYIKHINNVLLSSIIEQNKKFVRVLHYQSDKEMLINQESYPDCFSGKIWNKDNDDGYEIFYCQMPQTTYNSCSDIIRSSMRRVPDVICIGDLNPGLEIDSSLIKAAQSGHLVVLGFQADDETEAKNKIVNALLSKGNMSENDARQRFDIVLQHIINLNK